jgi:hypothetical protein
MAQPAFGFGSSTPKQESKRERELTRQVNERLSATSKIELRPLGKTAEEMEQERDKEHRRHTAREKVIRLQPTRDKEYRQLRLQDSGEVRGTELRPQGQIINQQRMHTPARPKEPDSPEFKTPYQSEGERIKHSEIAHDDRSLSHDEVTIDFNQMISYLESNQDQRVTSEELAEINHQLHARGIQTIHKNTTKASTILSKLKSKLEDTGDVVQSKLGGLKRSATQKFNSLLDSASKK